MKTILLKNRGIVLITCLLCIISSFTNVTAGYMLSYLYKGISADSIDTLFSSSIILVLIWLLALLSTYIKTIFESKAIQKMNNTLRNDICNKIISLDYESFHKMDSGNYVSWLTNDVNQINSLGFLKFFSIIESLFALIFTFIALTMLHYAISLAALALFLFMFVVPKVTNKRLALYTKAVSMEQEKFVESTKETIMGYNVFIGFNLLPHIYKRIGKYSNELENVIYAFRKNQSLVKTLIGVTNVASQLGLLFVTVYLVISKLTPAGAILSVTNLGGSFFSSLVNILNSYVALKSSRPIFEKFEFNDEKNDTNLLNCPQNINKIEFNNIAYGYSEDLIFHDINMTFERGKKYAILGESGSGKTTLIKILLGFIKNYNGEILIDGVNKELYNNESIRENFAYIDQNVYLFNATVRDNITLGRNYSDSEIYRALKNSRIYDFINSTNEKLETIIEENGKNLSGGQKQRIAIARALVSGKSFIIIDEGTSAIDEKNATDIESVLVDNPDLTVIFITHNLRKDVKHKLDKVYTINNVISSELVFH